MKKYLITTLTLILSISTLAQDNINDCYFVAIKLPNSFYGLQGYGGRNKYMIIYIREIDKMTGGNKRIGPINQVTIKLDNKPESGFYKLSNDLQKDQRIVEMFDPGEFIKIMLPKGRYTFSFGFGSTQGGEVWFLTIPFNTEKYFPTGKLILLKPSLKNYELKPKEITIFKEKVTLE